MLCIRAVLSPCDLSSQPTDAEEGGKVQGKRLKESGEVTWHASKHGGWQADSLSSLSLCFCALPSCRAWAARQLALGHDHAQTHQDASTLPSQRVTCTA
jgi:hypothetical protein